MFDNAFSSLLEDLQDRRLLSNTMVLAMGEFGRTPKINPAGGRDHWPQCWTVIMGGGPLKGGQVVGASDDIGGAPKDRPTTPGEIAATIYHGLGISTGLELPGAQGLDGEQAQEVWVGTGWSLASLALAMGRDAEAWELGESLYRTIYEESGLWFRTPEAWTEDRRYRAAVYHRPLAVWSLVTALRLRESAAVS